MYQPHTKKVVSITPVPPPSPAQAQLDELDVSDAQLLEAARELEKEVEVASPLATANAETVEKAKSLPLKLTLCLIIKLY